MTRYLILLGILFLSAFKIQAQPTIDNYGITANNGKYNMLEVGIAIGNLPGGDFNPYDPEHIDVQVHFHHLASGYTKIATGFPYVSYNIGPGPGCTGTTMAQNEFLSPSPNPYPWRARIAPPYVGQWTYQVVINTNGNITSSPILTFTVNGSSNKGYVGNNPSPGLKGSELGTYYFTNGDSYFPTGTNLHLYDQPYCRLWFDMYKLRLTQLAGVGGNYTRFLMSGDGWNGQNGFIFNVEWGANANLGNYDAKQNIAFVFDNLLQQAEESGLYYQLGLLTYGDMSSNWANNPFSQIAGLQSTPHLFYTNTEGKRLFKQRLRYILARWGYSTNIFSWELFCEVEGNAPSNTADLVNWIDEMSGYIKNVDNNHLLTVSTMQENFDQDPNSLHGQINLLSNIDFMSHHVYASSESYNFAHYRRENGIAKSHQFEKPFFAGEFGNGHKPGFPTLQLLEHDGGTTINEHNQFHNTIWSSSFSGQSGTSATWYPYVFNNHPNSVIKHITPLRILIDNINFKTQHFESISSTCDEPTLSHLNMTPDDHTAFSDPDIYEGGFTGCGYWHGQYSDNVSNGIYKEYISFANADDPITGSMASKVLILGLKSTENIYGWIHKKDNFWWKLPHLGWIDHPSNPLSTANTPNPVTEPPFGMPIESFSNNCSYYYNSSTTQAPPKPADADACHNKSLENVEAIFHNVCNGEYYIDYYSTYPKKPTYYNQPGGTLGPDVDGGIIATLGRRLFTGANTLSIKIPKLEPFSTTRSIYAPDYGYRIRKVATENYTRVPIGHIIPAQQAYHSRIEAFHRTGSQIFFVGLNDNYLQHHYYNYTTNQWVHTPMTPTQSVFEKADGDIAVDNYAEDKVFYRGMVDDAVHMYQFAGTTWSHSVLNPNAGSSELVHEESELQATSDQVFYRGQSDDKMHMYYKNGSAWTHTLLNPSAGSGETVSTSIAIPQPEQPSTNHVFFTQVVQGTNPYVQIGLYTRNGANSNPWIYSLVSQHNASQPENDPSFKHALLTNKTSTIASGYVNGQLYVFYIGTDKQIQYYKDVAGTWVHGRMSTDVDKTADRQSHLFLKDNVLYYYSDTHGVIMRYYFDKFEWRHSFIATCSNSEEAHMENFRYGIDGNIVFVGSTSTIYMLWNQRNCEMCEPYEGGQVIGTEQDNDKYDIYQSTVTSSLNSTGKPGDKRYQSQDNNYSSKVFSNSDYKTYTSEDNNYRLAIYPNPASDKVNVMLSNTTGDIVILKMCNTLGAVIKTTTLAPNTVRYELPVGELPRGLYYISLTEKSGKVITTQKISLR